MSSFAKRLTKIRFHFTITISAAIARRYFVIGAFDGALTILGVILGAYVTGFRTGRHGWVLTGTGSRM